jgi:hypothetical protein
MFTILQNRKPSLRYTGTRIVLTAVLMLPLVILTSNASAKPKFQVEEATIADIQHAIKTRQITTTELVHLYLDRIRAYNGVCVNEPLGILGPISTIPNAGQLNALMTLNLRPPTRIAMGFDDRKARSMTDLVDGDPNMPDALEVAAALDAEFEKTTKLSGPLHGIVFSIKDAYDTFDMRTTSGADAFYTNDRPPDDATFVKRLRDAGAIILAKANMENTKVESGAHLAGQYATLMILNVLRVAQAEAPPHRWQQTWSRAALQRNLVHRCAGRPGTTTLSGLHRHESWSAQMG